LAVTFTALIIVAANEVKRKHAQRDRAKAEASAARLTGKFEPEPETASEEVAEGESVDFVVDSGGQPATATVLGKTGI